MSSNIKKHLNLSLFVSSRLEGRGKNNFSRVITRIAIGSVATGLAVMILSFAIFTGFRNAIQDKIFSFSAHIRASKFVMSNSYEEIPVATSYDLYQTGSEIAGVEHIQVYSRKAGILKTDEEVYGVVVKGVGTDFDTTRFANNLLEGRFPDLKGDEISTEILISKKIADLLGLKLHDDVIIYFVQDPPRVRKLTIAGIYLTGIEDFDEKIIVADNQLIQRVNNWSDSLVGGFEIYVSDFDKLDEVYERVYDEMDYDLGIVKVTDSYVQFFDWFVMLNRNVFVFLSVILFIACFNIFSIVLILIMERTNMIGTLKALGSTSKQIRQIFVYKGYRIIITGLLLGNVAGLGLGYLQMKYRIVPLDPENYYMSAVPIVIEWPVVLVLNLVLVLLVGFILAVPTRIITSMEPIRTIKFD